MEIVEIVWFVPIDTVYIVMIVTSSFHILF